MDGEPVVVEVLDVIVRLELDDGGYIDFDGSELRAAVQSDVRPGARRTS